MNRVSRETVFMTMAIVLAERSTCPRARVGALLVKDNRVVSTGYNGSPSGMPHCDQTGCRMDNTGSCIRTVHAETNVVAYAARAGISTQDTTLYTTLSPCYGCSKLLVNAGIVEVVYATKYKDISGLDLLRECGILCRVYIPESGDYTRLYISKSH